MKIKEVKSVVPKLMKTGIVPILWGSHGIGKTEVVRQIAKSEGLDLVYLTFGAVEDVGDIIGLQDFVVEDGKKFTEHAAPSWFPREGNKLIFIDEFSRANGSVMQAMFPFILEGKLHTHQLPDNCYIVLAANPPIDGFTTTNFEDNALYSRMCHINFEPDYKDFTNFLMKKGAPNVFAAYVDNYKQDFQYSIDFKHDFLSRNNRGIEMCIDFYQDHKGSPRFDSEFRRVCIGLLGLTEGTRLSKYIKENDKYFTVEEMFRSFKSVESKLSALVKSGKNDILSKLVLDLITEFKNENIELSDKNVKTTVKFFKVLPEELKFKFLSEYLERGMIKLDEALSSDKEMVEICTELNAKTRG